MCFRKTFSFPKTKCLAHGNSPTCSWFSGVNPIIYYVGRASGQSLYEVAIQNTLLVYRRSWFSEDAPEVNLLSPAVMINTHIGANAVSSLTTPFAGMATIQPDATHSTHSSNKIICTKRKSDSCTQRGCDKKLVLTGSCMLLIPKVPVFY